MNTRKISKAVARTEQSEIRGPCGPTGDAALGSIGRALPRRGIGCESAFRLLLH